MYIHILAIVDGNGHTHTHIWHYSNNYKGFAYNSFHLKMTLCKTEDKSIYVMLHFLMYDMSL
jgi:hypothetical protein